MPYDDPAATDPMTFHAMEVETDDPNSMRAMAECFAEEFARSGLSAGAIIELFRSGEYAGPALAHARLGAAAIQEIVEMQLAIRGPRGARLDVDNRADGSVGLPVMTAL